jgi:hypothetical protein
MRGLLYEFCSGVLDCMKRAVLFACFVIASPFIALWWTAELIVEVWKEQP